MTIQRDISQTAPVHWSSSFGGFVHLTHEQELKRTGESGLTGVCQLLQTTGWVLKGATGWAWLAPLGIDGPG